MGEHTPGPWSEPYQDDYPGDEGWWILNGKSGIDEYAVCVTFWGNPNQEADAYLIAAAPNLLSVCKMVQDLAPSLPPWWFDEAEGVSYDGIVRQAVAKAQGE